jgi:hypothetical protein
MKKKMWKSEHSRSYGRDEEVYYFEPSRGGWLVAYFPEFGHVYYATGTGRDNLFELPEGSTVADAKAAVITLWQLQGGDLSDYAD